MSDSFQRNQLSFAKTNNSRGITALKYRSGDLTYFAFHCVYVPFIVPYALHVSDAWRSLKVNDFDLELSIVWGRKTFEAGSATVSLVWWGPLFFCRYHAIHAA